MQKILRLLFVTMAIAGIIGVVVLLIGLIFRWHSTTQFSDGFFWEGVLLIVVGALSVFGGFGMRSNFFNVNSICRGYESP